MPQTQYIGRYEILAPIGSGGMGTLWRARDPKIGGRTVAIKLLKEGIDNEEIRRRFMQEANAAGVLEHENIVRIFDVGEHDGEPFIAMEYIDGETLSAWIRRKEPAPLVRKLKLMEELCDGLAYAHTFGIVHRDVKPANLMVERRRGRLKILDFGIAKLADSGITNAGALIGSFNYMSPEQVRGLPIDLRSDIFSVGAVLFELFSYRQAFPGGLGDGVLGRIAEQPAPRLSQALPGVDAELEQVVVRALEKDPGKRYQDLMALHRDLTRVRRRLERDDSSEHQTSLRPIEPRPAHTPPPGTPKPRSADAERLARVRAQQVEEHLAAAERALAAGHLEEAIDHTYRASAIDEENARALELRDRAHAALEEREAGRLLNEARGALGRGDLERAESFVEQARGARADHPELRDVQQSIGRARNQRLAAAALDHARVSLEARDWTAAIRAVAEVEHYQPGLDEARVIRQRAQTALEEQRRAEAHEQAARQAIAEARQRVGQRDYHGAIELLAAFAPPHPAVARELERHRAELAALEERTAQERQRQERIRRAVESARRAVLAGAFDEAAAHADAVAHEGAETRLVQGLRAEIEAARQQAIAEARRQKQIDALVSEARAKFDTGEYRAAIVRCDAALRLQPDEPRAADLRARSQRAVEAEEDRRRREAEEARQRQAAEAEARRAAEEAERRRREAEEAQRRREAHDRAAAEAIAHARREFAGGRHRPALDHLSRFSPAHPSVDEARSELQDELAALEAEAAHAASAARELFAAGRIDEAFARLDEIRAGDFRVVHDTRAALEQEQRRRAQAAEQARFEEEQRRLAEEQRRQRLEHVGRLTASARELADAQRFDEALAALAEAAGLEPGDAELAELTRQVRAAKAERETADRRAREIERILADAEERLARGQFAKARKRVDEALAKESQHGAALALRDRIAEAEAQQQQEEEARRRAEAEARQARERESRAASLLKKARKARKPADAVALLEEALGLVPDHAEARALLDARRAEQVEGEATLLTPGAGRAASPAAEAELVRTPGVPERVRAAPIPLPALAAAAVVVAALLGGAIWYSMRPEPTPGTGTVSGPVEKPVEPPPAPTPVPAPPAPPGMAAVSIDVTPWARVTLTPAGGGKAVTCTTPCALELTEGDYNLAFENGGLSRPHAERLTVTPGRPIELRRTMPGFSPDRAVTTILGPSSSQP